MKKIIEHGLYLLVFLLPWQTRWIIKAGEINNGYWEYGTTSLYGTDILLMIILFVWLFLKIIKPSDQNVTSTVARKKYVTYFILGLAVVNFISFIFSLDKALSFYIFLRLLIALGFFYLIIDANYKYSKLLFCLSSGLAFTALLALWQFIFQNSFANKWLGLARHQAAELGTSVIEIYRVADLPERWLRAYGTFDHPNMLGGAMVIGIFISLKLLLNYQIKETAIKNNKINAVFLFLYFYVSIFSVALFFSFSRAAWISFVFGFILLLLPLLKNNKRKELKVALGVLGISMISILPFFYIYQDLAVARFSSQTRLEKKSIEERVSSNRDALEIIKAQPWLGVGPGGYGLAVAQNYSKQQSWYYQPTHNVFLLIWVESGILGLLLFIAVLVNLIIKNFKVDKAINLAIISAVIILMLFDHWLWSLHFGIITSWLLIGLMQKEQNEHNQVYGD